jgi:cytochrome c oxidase assembly protein subunit 15
MLAKTKTAKFFRLALYACALAFVSLAFNAYARLAEAGLGCPDWPGCYGTLFAPLTAQDVEQARAFEDRTKLEKKRAALETMQRFLAGVLSLVLIRLAALGWQLKKRKRSQQVIFPIVTLVAAFGLSFVGFLTFEYRHTPLVMMTQLLGGLTILLLLWWIVLRELRFFRPVSQAVAARLRRLRWRVWLAFALVSGEIVLGGWSMVNYAGLACPDFPACQGSWWPPMEPIEAFTLWQHHGLQYEGKFLALPAATAIHMAHRLGAFLVLLYVGWLTLHLLRIGSEDNVCRYALLILLILLAQTALGVVQVVAHLPLAVAVAHSALAALLLMSLVTLYHVLRPPRPE